MPDTSAQIAHFRDQVAHAESANARGDFDAALEFLGELDDEVYGLDDSDPLANRYWVAHAVATDRLADYRQ